MNFEVYCDESRQEYFWTKADSPHNRYVLIGSLWLESSQRAQIKAEIKALRAKHNLFGEFKWKRVSPSRQQFYVDLIDLFFHSSMRFRAIVLPANQLNAIQFHNADNELMFYKFYYQLLHHWILDFNTYRIFVDAKTNRVRERPAHLRRILDQANYFADVAMVQALPSREVDLLQFVDVLTGAVGYHFHQMTTSQAKLAVITQIEQNLGHLIRPTSRSENKFNIFRWRPGGGW